MEERPATGPVGSPQAMHYWEKIRAWQRDMTYPELLFESAGNGLPSFLCRKHRTSGLITTIIRHGALMETQWRALAEFRLHQFVLLGWYDAERVAADQLTADPMFRLLP